MTARQRRTETKSLCTLVALSSRRMSNEYRLLSSDAAVKLNASHGFHATMFARFSMTTLRRGVPARVSNKAMLV